MYKIRSWDKSVFEAATLDAAKTKVSEHLAGWMEPGDIVGWTSTSNASGRHVVIGQVFDSMREPTDACAVILTPDEF